MCLSPARICGILNWTAECSSVTAAAAYYLILSAACLCFDSCFSQNYRIKSQKNELKYSMMFCFLLPPTPQRVKQALALVRWVHLKKKKKSVLKSALDLLFSVCLTVSRPNHTVYWYYLYQVMTRTNDEQFHQNFGNFCAWLTHTSISVIRSYVSACTLQETTVRYCNIFFHLYAQSYKNSKRLLYYQLVKNYNGWMNE